MAILNLKASVLFFQFFLSLAQLTRSFSFDFPSFTNNSNEIITERSAYVSHNGSIELTPTSGIPYYKVGRVVYSKPIPLWDSSGTLSNFSTHFSFALSPMNLSNGSSDGIIFFLSPYPSLIPTNSDAQYFGVFNTSNVPNTIAVEFDTYLNKELQDISANHIGIDVETAVSVTSTDINFNMTNGYQSNAWINYDSNTHNLSVFFSYPQLSKNWSLNFTINLKEYLPQDVYVGFAATTGGYFQRNTLLSWNFTSSFSPSLSPEGTQTGGKKRMNVYLIVVPVVVLSIICLLVLWCVFFRPRISRYSTMNKPRSLSGPRQFTYDELAAATKNFESKLGRGASGEVFRGILTNLNTEVAIKRITGTELHGSRAYESELGILSQLSHRNLVQLLGYCDEDDRLLLVYEYMPNQSLDQHLYDVTSELEWPERYKIAIGLASALSYLHEDYNQCIIHRDVKPSNVMLDSEFNAKLGDFGIARLVDHGDIMRSTTAAGTFGYIAPDYYATGKASEESDIYSFGIVALEIACGRKPVESNFCLAKNVRRFYKSKKLLEVADKRLKEFNSQEMERLLIVGLSCCNPDPKLRMSMRKAVSILKFDCEFTNVIIDHDENNHVSSYLYNGDV